MPESINSKLKEQYDHDDSGGSLDTNLGDFLDSEGASGTSNNSKWRDWASGTGTSLNTRLFHKHGGSGSFMTRWKNWIAFSSTHSINFDGSNDYLAGSDLGLPSSNNARSVSFWINADSVTTYGMMFSYGTSSSNSAFAISWDNANAKIIVGKYGGNANSASSSTISTGSWNHIVVTFDGSSTIKYYLNGSADGTATLSGINTVVNEFRIGGYLNGWSGANFFDGKIDEVAVWNVELSASDVTSIYNNGKVIDLSKSASYGVDRTSNLEVWLRCGDKAEPESTTAIARQDFYTDFDGSNDRIDLGTPSDLLIPSGTYAVWA